MKKNQLKQWLVWLKYIITFEIWKKKTQALALRWEKKDKTRNC